MTDAPRNSGLALWLIASFVLNALLVGLIIGVFLAAPKGAQRSHAPVQVSDEVMARSIVAAAPLEERRQIRRKLVQVWQGAREERRELAEAGRAVADAIQADPYDPAEMAAAFERWRTADAELKSRLQAALADILAILPPERRAALANELMEKAARQRLRRQGQDNRRRLPPEQRDASPDGD